VVYRDATGDRAPAFVLMAWHSPDPPRAGGRRYRIIAKECSMTIKITPNDKGTPPGKVAEAELHFTDGPLDGLRLVGFAIWERRGGGAGEYNVTFPARQYTVNGDRRSFALLRPISDTTAQNKVRELILQAYQEYEERSAIAS
jgi:hypothetical protein